MTAIDRLNELLEAERAGVDTLSHLFPMARNPVMQKLFEEVSNDEAWSCAGLVRSIKAAYREHGSRLDRHASVQRQRRRTGATSRRFHRACWARRGAILKPSLRVVATFAMEELG